MAMHKAPQVYKALKKDVFNSRAGLQYGQRERETGEFFMATVNVVNQPEPSKDLTQPELKPTLGWFSATAIVAGSMIGSGIFVVTPDIARHVGSAGLLITVWVITGIITVLGAGSYGKLAAHMPKAGGQYVFLREAWGDVPAFLYGWVLFTVIQTGFLAAVAVAFAKYAGVLFPVISTEPFLMLGGFGLSTQKVLSVLTLLGLTLFNCTGIKNGALLQNVFTSLKVLSLILLILVGLTMGTNLTGGVHDWSLSLPVNHEMAGGLITLFAFASVGALFSADAWNYVTFIGGEVKEPRKNLPVALLWGSLTVVVLYIVANFAYLNLLSMEQIQTADNDRVATVAIDTVFPGYGTMIMAVIILISTFGCLNGLLLAGARVFYAMAKDGLLFRKFGEVHPRTHSPNFSMWMQFAWASVLALSGSYSVLLGYIVFATLLFYIVTMLGLMKMGKQRPAEMQMTRPIDWAIPVLYVVGAAFIAFYLLFGDILIGPLPPLGSGAFYETKLFTSLAGLGLTLIGLPVYFIWKQKSATA